MRIDSRSPAEESFYLQRRRWEKEAQDPQDIEEFQIVNLLRDDLVNEGMAVILRELPEFHIRVPKPYLDYMALWLFHDFIDPLNDLNKELKMAFELRRGYRREDC